MVDELTEVAAAECANCGGLITLMTGSWSGRRWYHEGQGDEGGSQYCPGAPKAEPVSATVRITGGEG